MAGLHMFGSLQRELLSFIGSHTNVAACCRYDGILEEILQDMDISQALPAAMLEHIVIQSAASSADALPDQSRLFVSQPRPGAESIDLLMCAASAGNHSVTSALIRAGGDSVFHCLSSAM